MKTPNFHPKTPTAPEVPDLPTATGASDFRVAIMQFGLQYDVPLPLDYFDELISRSGAFSARAKGELELEEVRSRAAVKPSELARYLRKESRLLPAQAKVA